MDTVISILEQAGQVNLDGLIVHPIVDFYKDEVSREIQTCPCDDCDPCDYEAN